MKKYELLLDDTRMISGVTLYRVRYIRDFADIRVGDLGGYIQKEENLSHSGDARVLDHAWVFGDARVLDNARVYDDASVSGNAQMYGDTLMLGDE